MKKKVISAMLAAAMIISVTGCGNNGGTESAKDTTASGTETAVSDTKKDGAATIEFWTNNRHDEAYMNEMIDSFNASHSDIQINYTILTDDWANSIQLAYQGGTAPDIISIQASDNMTLQTYVDAGMYFNIYDFMGVYEFLLFVWEAYEHKYERLTSFGDDIYWVPNGVRTGTRIEWNKDLVNAAGATEIPSKLSDFVELAKAATNDSTYGIAFTSSSPFSRWLEGCGEMSGATPGGYDYANGVYDFSSWKEIVEEAAKLYADGSVLPGSENQGVDNSRALFAQGAFALWGNASQEAGVFTDQFPCSFDWGVAELPTLTGEVKGALSCSPNGGDVMLSSCENKDAAWEVIKYFSSEDFL